MFLPLDSALVASTSSAVHEHRPSRRGTQRTQQQQQQPRDDNQAGGTDSGRTKEARTNEEASTNTNTNTNTIPSTIAVRDPTFSWGTTTSRPLRPGYGVGANSGSIGRSRQRRSSKRRSLPLPLLPTQNTQSEAATATTAATTTTTATTATTRGIDRFREDRKHKDPPPSKDATRNTIQTSRRRSRGGSSNGSGNGNGSIESPAPARSRRENSNSTAREQQQQQQQQHHRDSTPFVHSHSSSKMVAARKIRSTPFRTRRGARYGDGGGGGGGGGNTRTQPHSSEPIPPSIVTTNTEANANANANANDDATATAGIARFRTNPGHRNRYGRSALALAIHQNEDPFLFENDRTSVPSSRPSANGPLAPVEKNHRRDAVAVAVAVALPVRHDGNSNNNNNSNSNNNDVAGKPSDPHPNPNPTASQPQPQPQSQAKIKHLPSKKRSDGASPPRCEAREQILVLPPNDPGPSNSGHRAETTTTTSPPVVEVVVVGTNRKRKRTRKRTNRKRTPPPGDDAGSPKRVATTTAGNPRAIFVSHEHPLQLQPRTAFRNDSGHRGKESEPNGPRSGCTHASVPDSVVVAEHGRRRSTATTTTSSSIRKDSQGSPVAASIEHPDRNNGTNKNKNKNNDNSKNNDNDNDNSKNNHKSSDKSNDKSNSKIHAPTQPRSRRLTKENLQALELRNQESQSRHEDKNNDMNNNMNNNNNNNNNNDYDPRLRDQPTNPGLSISRGSTEIMGVSPPEALRRRAEAVNFDGNCDGNCNCNSLVADDDWVRSSVRPSDQRILSRLGWPSEGGHNNINNNNNDDDGEDRSGTTRHPTRKKLLDDFDAVASTDNEGDGDGDGYAPRRFLFGTVPDSVADSDGVVPRGNRLVPGRARGDGNGDDVAALVVARASNAAATEKKTSESRGGNRNGSHTTNTYTNTYTNAQQRSTAALDENIAALLEAFETKKTKRASVVRVAGTASVADRYLSGTVASPGAHSSDKNAEASAPQPTIRRRSRERIVRRDRDKDRDKDAARRVSLESPLFSRSVVGKRERWTRACPVESNSIGSDSDSDSCSDSPSTPAGRNRGAAAKRNGNDNDNSGTGSREGNHHAKSTPIPIPIPITKSDTAPVRKSLFQMYYGDEAEDSDWSADWDAHRNRVGGVCRRILRNKQGEGDTDDDNSPNGAANLARGDEENDIRCKPSASTSASTTTQKQINARKARTNSRTNPKKSSRRTQRKSKSSFSEDFDLPALSSSPPRSEPPVINRYYSRASDRRGGATTVTGRRHGCGYGYGYKHSVRCALVALVFVLWVVARVGFDYDPEHGVPGAHRYSCGVRVRVRDAMDRRSHRSLPRWRRRIVHPPPPIRFSTNPSLTLVQAARMHTGSAVM